MLNKFQNSHPDINSVLSLLPFQQNQNNIPTPRRPSSRSSNNRDNNDHRNSNTNTTTDNNSTSSSTPRHINSNKPTSSPYLSPRAGLHVPNSALLASPRSTRKGTSTASLESTTPRSTSSTSSPRPTIPVHNRGKSNSQDYNSSAMNEMYIPEESKKIVVGNQVIKDRIKMVSIHILLLLLILILIAFIYSPYHMQEEEERRRMDKERESEFKQKQKEILVEKEKIKLEMERIKEEKRLQELDRR